MSKLTENMKNNTFPKALLKKISFALVICMMFSLCGCNKEIENTKISESVTVTESAATTAGTTETRSPESAESTVSSETTEITATADPEVIQDIVEEMVIDYGTYGSDADDRIDSLLEDLYVADKTAGEKWTKIMDMWRSPNLGEPLNYDVLPDGLPDTDELCIVVLGFQLNPDGSMKNELVNRLTVALESAQKYPKAYIVCTGGGTAYDNANATEAGEMAKWLEAQGIDKDRIIVEDNSLTTAQNAIFTYDILTSDYPSVKYLAIVSSDYHIATGELLFTSEAILRASAPGEEKLKVISNASWDAPSGTLSVMFQAGALIELSGDTGTAFDIYYGNYDIHELPPLN